MELDNLFCNIFHETSFLASNFFWATDKTKERKQNLHWTKLSSLEHDERRMVGFNGENLIIYSFKSVILGITVARDEEITLRFIYYFFTICLWVSATLEVTVGQRATTSKISQKTLLFSVEVQGKNNQFCWPFYRET